MTFRAIEATPRAIRAVKKADRLPRDLTVTKRNRITSPGSGSSGLGAFPCISTGPLEAGKVPVDVYANGLAEEKTGTADLYIMQIYISSDVPVGTKLIGYETTIANYNDEV
jgi:hypothetical protein